MSTAHELEVEQVKELARKFLAIGEVPARVFVLACLDAAVTALRLVAKLSEHDALLALETTVKEMLKVTPS